MPRPQAARRQLTQKRSGRPEYVTIHCRASTSWALLLFIVQAQCCSRQHICNSDMRLAGLYEGGKRKNELWSQCLQVDDTPPEEGTGETEEECQAEFRPLVQLEEVEKESGEEGETALIDM